MNTSFFIAKRLENQDAHAFSATVIRIATGSIALGVAVMLVAFGVLEGFRQNISQKVFSFAAHLNVTTFNGNNYYEEQPISTLEKGVAAIKHLPDVAAVQSYVFKPALLKTKEAVQGIVIKGIDANFYSPAFAPNMTAGRLPNTADTNHVTEVVISKKLANMLLLKPSDEVIMYFMQNPTRLRKVQIVGIYDTGMEEFDESIVLGNARMLRQINAWPDSLSSGVEVFGKNFDQLEQLHNEVANLLPYYMSAIKVTDQHIQIFEWLEMIGRNVDILLVLITVVACFSIISSLLIMILERTRMIGVLKALGATDAQIRGIFLWSGLKLTARGLLFGNVIGLGVCALQYYFKIIPLDPENYYMYFVPIEWNIWPILSLNVMTIVIAALVLLLPTRVIASIQPIKAIKFD
ncbi:lipoprotein-releasing system permease protein [Flexibacter flexilis DSM 6793]|uniref:Lipoprotein-releasing system permease protein n=1 Tax=Flexibacter flexilis DSM 6793 TaxID=927664 RepID=A0A1I1EBI2_9BACT|nr:FtsX-like permease family protein [Flexibacter flexilis]SFB82340.1 lipoprotein-releasing system permease protein [Flexibacter flexilis DSM 6793]